VRSVRVAGLGDSLRAESTSRTALQAALDGDRAGRMSAGVAAAAGMASLLPRRSLTPALTRAGGSGYWP
jgi:hypothetical protein